MRSLLPVILALLLASPALGAERTVVVTWDHSPDLPYLVSYRVYWYDETASGQVWTKTVPADMTSAEIRILGNGTRTVTITVYVTAIDTRGLESIPSNSVQDGRPYGAGGLRLLSRSAP